jgi:hypothetical protein
LWVLRTHPQAEITSNFNDRYLATSVNHDWVCLDGENLSRLPIRQISGAQLQREDL